MNVKYFLPWIGRLYRQRDIARIERDAARNERAITAFDDLPTFLMQRIPEYAPFPDWGKESFLKHIPALSCILDVGCGNNSPIYTKNIIPSSYYIGLDIGDYNQLQPNVADEYIITTSEDFCGEIAKFKGRFDAVISSHNIEHCEKRNDVIEAMAQALKIGGNIYLSFPCSDSLRFPNRGGCLNYYDDSTHKYGPPAFSEVIAVLERNNCRVLYASTRYQPPIGWVIGLYNEPESARDKEVKRDTWAFWGFETVIWAERQ
jgi:SAM-dependent methyltransferase